VVCDCVSCARRLCVLCDVCLYVFVMCGCLCDICLVFVCDMCGCDVLVVWFYV